jgi:hypothetical protein
MVMYQNAHIKLLGIHIIEFLVADLDHSIFDRNMLLYCICCLHDHPTCIFCIGNIDSMEQSPPWITQDSKKISHLSWNPKVITIYTGALTGNIKGRITWIY